MLQKYLRLTVVVWRFSETKGNVRIADTSVSKFRSKLHWSNCRYTNIHLDNKIQSLCNLCVNYTNLFFNRSRNESNVVVTMLFKIFHVALKMKANHLYPWNTKILIQHTVKNEITTQEVQTILQLRFHWEIFLLNNLNKITASWNVISSLNHCFLIYH